MALTYAYVDAVVVVDHMPDRQALLKFLANADKAIPAADRKITLVGAGDTALALLELKPPTVHLDFTGPDSDDLVAFERACTTNTNTATSTATTTTAAGAGAAIPPPNGFQVHIWNGGKVFGQQLPDDYIKASMQVSAGLLNRIDLRALHPLDIVATKIEKLAESDMRDIKACIRQFKLGKNQISKRARALQSVGDEAKFERNLEHVLSLYYA